jgi:hypothetical protein
MSSDFRFLMIGAMYENGGNTTHRFLDGHPELYVYPFESQLGTRLPSGMLAAAFPAKYRWPIFALDAEPEDDYRSIIDEECKVRVRTPHVSKFRHVPFDLSDDRRREIYVAQVRQAGRSRANNVAAFYRATFEAWSDRRSTGQEQVYVGYSPIVTVDAEVVLQDLPQAQFLHVVRNPWSAYADTNTRPVPLSLDDYMLGWTLTQRFALLVKDRYPDRMHVLRFEDLVADSVLSLSAICRALGVDDSDSLARPTWNGEPVQEVKPWGTIREPTPKANRDTADELSGDEKDRVRQAAGLYLQVFGYEDFLAG